MKHKYNYIEHEELTSPSKGQYFQLVKDHWWLFDADKGGFVFYSYPGRLGPGVPQCNSNEMITRDWQKMIYRGEGRVAVVFLEKAFVPIDPREFE